MGLHENDLTRRKNTERKQPPPEGGRELRRLTGAELFLFTGIAGNDLPTVRALSGSEQMRVNRKAQYDLNDR